jgi:hypothetical protein
VGGNPGNCADLRVECPAPLGLHEDPFGQFLITGCRGDAHQLGVVGDLDGKEREEVQAVK